MSQFNTAQLPFVSVIIPVYNAEKYLTQCLKMIGSQSYPHNAYEVIVVDNGSTDQSISIAGAFEITLLHEPLKGPSAARNTGVKAARGELLLFIDADCLAEPALIINHVNRHREFQILNSNVKIVGGGIGGINNSFWAICDDYCSWYLNHPRLKPRLEPRYLPTANLSVQRDFFHRIGGFKVGLNIGEDVHFCTQGRNLGATIFFAPEARVNHINRTSFSSFINHARDWAKVGSSTEQTNVQNQPITDQPRIIQLTYNLVYFAYRFFELIWCWLQGRRFAVFFFLPFIFLNKLVFGYYMLKSRSQSKQRTLLSENTP